MWTVNFQMFKLVLEKAEEPEIKLPTSTGSWKKQESSRKNIYFCFIDYAKAFDWVHHNRLWKKQQLELDMEKTGSELEKDYVRTVYCHSAYLTSMQSTSWETVDWKKHKLESRLPGQQKSQ